MKTRPDNRTPARPDGRAVAREHETRVLRALHRFGWLRTRDVAALIFTRWASRPVAHPSLAPVVGTASALRMAQRTLRRMKDARLVLAAMGPDGSTVYALAEGGTRVLQSIGIVAGSGKDAVRGISPGHFRHRCISNEVAIAGIVQGLRVSTEREISRGLWVGGDAGVAGKRPDVLCRSGDAWTWVEVQRSRYNVRDYAQLFAWLRALNVAASGGAFQFGSGTLRHVVFICNGAMEAKLRRDLAEKGMSSLLDSGLLVFERSLYAFETIRFAP
jgi:hypothetical protein